MVPAVQLRSVLKLILLRMLPLIISCRCLVPLFVEHSGYICDPHTAYRSFKYFSDNRCCLRINHQLMIILRIFHKPEWHMTANIFSAFHLRTFSCCDLYRKVFAVIVIYNILHHYIESTGGSLVVQTIVMIIDGDEPNAQKRKNTLQIITQFNIITAKTRKVLHNDTVDGSALNLFQQSLK